jgi:hypothetical protein
VDTSGYVSRESGPNAEYGLDGFRAVQRGRRTEALQTLGMVLILFAAQWPMRQVATGRWESTHAATFGAVVPGRLSLMVDAAMIFAYLLLAYRSFGLLRSLRPAGWLLRLNAVLVGVVFAGAAMDLWEDWKLWRLVDQRLVSRDSLTLSWNAGLGVDLGVATFSAAVHVLVFGGLILLGVTFVLGLRGAHDRYTDPSDAGSRETGGDVICCSGGGIRSAAFSLGGLEALADAGIYASARAVLGVSGGGYMGAAYHVARWNPGDTDDTSAEWPGRVGSGGASPYGLPSPETGWVRRHTRYVLGSVKVALQAVLSLAFGIAVNLLLLAALLGGLAWVLGWLFVASGRLPHGSFGQDWSPVEDVWWLPAAGVGLFVARKVVERWWIPSARTRGTAERATSVLIVGGGAAAILLLGVPWLLQSLDSFAAGNSSVWADLVRALGLSTTKSQVASSSAAKVSGATIGAIVSAILAVLGSVKSAGKESATGDSGLGKVWATIWKKVKDPLVPWVALIAVVLVLVIVLLRWVAALVADPTLLTHWELAYWFGGLLVFAKLGTDANRTSLHHFFRERISGAFLVRKVGARVEPIPYRRPLRFSESDPLDGGPELIACAVANVSDEEIVPSKRGCVPFVFDHTAIGLTDRLLPPGAGRRESATYEFAADPWYHDATVPAALAMSAAAFSPLAGRENVRLGPYRAVLALANARLGVWLPNPLWVDEVGLFKRLRRLGRWEEAARTLDRLRGTASERPEHPKLDDEEWERYEGLARLSHEVAARRRSADAAAKAVARLRAELGGAATGAGTLEARNMLEQLLAEVRRAQEQLEHAEAQVEKTVDSFPERGTRGWKYVEGARAVFKKPGLARLAKEAVGKASIYDRFLYVTDGGHYDNLGLIEALRRRPDRIILLDASNDKEDSFRTLGRTIATARMDLDCDVRLDPRNMRRISKVKPARAAWCVGSYKFSDTDQEGQIFLCKAVMVGDVTWDIQTYADDNPDFPRTSTNNQLYSEFDFEAYRALGHATVSDLIDPTSDAAAIEVALF